MLLYTLVRTYAGKLKNWVSGRCLFVKTMIYCWNGVSLLKSCLV